MPLVDKSQDVFRDIIANAIKGQMAQVTGRKWILQLGPNLIQAEQRVRCQCHDERREELDALNQREWQ
ncbi:MAG: hypothetical protein FJ146_20000 [Deltaproteobacteria bacterium]|nr:hypothetical protein [Deltaproteobacteria bacterium]